jgi:LmbE family N-acetylglucosaminyl deacetylase
MLKKIAVIAAHPDDEVLGCGGTIARRVRAGDEVVSLIIAEGVTSRDGARDSAIRASDISQMRGAAKAANLTLGVQTVEFGGLPDNRLDSMDLLDVVKLVEDFIERHKPRMVLTHAAVDLNIDHEIVSRAVSTACRPLPASQISSLLFFEIPSSTEWQTNSAKGAFWPNWYEDIGSTLDVKLEALHHYASEMRPWPHPRSYQAVEALARWRGASVGLAAAEAFALGRELVLGD